MNITANDIARTVEMLMELRKNAPWYKFVEKFRLKVMAATLMGVIQVDAEMNTGRQTVCGCGGNHSSHNSN